MREVAVIVPVYGGLRYLRNCLESLMAHPQQTAHGVVIIDDASPEIAVAELLAEFSIRHPTVSAATRVQSRSSRIIICHHRFALSRSPLMPPL